MNLNILLPFHIFIEKTEVSRIVVETLDGSYGLLPRRRDCVAALTPGILTYTTDEGTEVYVAVDKGVLVKTGADVRVSVRGAFTGSDLNELRRVVEQEFLSLSKQEENVRMVMAKLETGFLRRFASFSTHHPE